MAQRNVFDDGQAQTVAACGAVMAFIGAIKSLGQARQLVERHAHARVAHPKGKSPTRANQRAHRDFAAFGRVTQRIAQQIMASNQQQTFIAQHHRQIVG